MSKVNVGVLFGGRSSEHEVSLLSAYNVLRSIPKKKYNVLPIGIKKDGSFLFYSKAKPILNGDDAKKIHLSAAGQPITFTFGSSHRIHYLNTKKNGQKIDMLFPVLHGTFGEDGTVQGLAQLLDVPCVGASVLGSAIGMDKDISKRLLRDAKIPIADFLVFRKDERATIDFDAIAKKLGLPFFLKPATAGSSVGVHKVKSKKEFSSLVDDAFLYSDKILFERFLNGVEVECAVLGNERPIISLPGIIIPQHDFYSYEAKYLDADGAKFQIPARFPKKITQKIQQTALKTYTTLECQGMARVDGFLTKKGSFFINEINTIPGFTNISMYPKLWEVSGISYSDLLDRLIVLAIKRHNT